MTEHKRDTNITKIAKIDKYKKKKKKKNLNSTSTAEYNCTLVNQTISIYKFNKGMTNLKAPHKKG